MAHYAVIGAAGDVGQGIVGTLVAQGHRVSACGRDPSKLQALPGVHPVPGSLGSDVSAQALAARVRAAGPLDGVVVSVNTRRAIGPVLEKHSDELVEALAGDLLTHFSALRAFLPVLAPGALFLGIGGGSADFILEQGTHLSVAQAGLRMLYRGVAHECRAGQAQVKELIIASVVNAPSTASFADPSWVTAIEIGELAGNMLKAPEAYPGPIWRIARRDETGLPLITAELPTRIQGFGDQEKTFGALAAS